MSGCSESDADRFQRASAAAGQICWDFSVGLGLGQEAFGRYGTPSMYSVFPITELTAHTFCTSHDPLFRVFFQASPFSKPLFFMPVTLYTSCFLSFCLQTCFASSLVRVPPYPALLSRAVNVWRASVLLMNVLWFSVLPTLKSSGKVK